LRKQYTKNRIELGVMQTLKGINVFPQATVIAHIFQVFSNRLHQRTLSKTQDSLGARGPDKLKNLCMDDTVGL
ncbi:hypothetical protein, partial [Deinococcus misasensis]|uniref:hypothetical protein n=1 Tax=Deinococcus misasensis TaxID=392413 RepID=UPI001B80998D